MSEPAKCTRSTRANCHVDSCTQTGSLIDDSKPVGHARHFLNSVHASEVVGAIARLEPASKQQMKHADSFVDALHKSKTRQI